MENGKEWRVGYSKAKIGRKYFILRTFSSLLPSSSIPFSFLLHNPFLPIFDSKTLSSISEGGTANMTLLHGIEITAREIGRGRGCGEKCLRTLTSRSGCSIIFSNKNGCLSRSTSRCGNYSVAPKGKHLRFFLLT